MLRRVRWARLAVVLLAATTTALALRLRAVERELLRRITVDIQGPRAIPVNNPVIDILDSRPFVVSSPPIVEVPDPIIETFTDEVSFPPREEWRPLVVHGEAPEPEPVPELVLEIYDVSDLLPPTEWPRTAHGSTELAALLLRAAGEREGASVELHRGQAIVSHSRRGHARIVETLRDLRTLRPR